VIKVYGCQQVLLHPDGDLKAILEYICTEANKLHNCATYYARQIWFKTRRYARKFDINNELKPNRHFKAMHSQAAQQTCQAVGEAFTSFRGLNQAYRNGELAYKPKPPKYRRRGGVHTVSYPKQALKLKDGQIRVPLGRQVKVWFGLDAFYVPMPSNLRFEDINELRILPRNRCFYAEFVYKQPVEAADVARERVLGIDPGLANWLTCVSNVETSFIVDGRQVKSLNRWYNKKVADLKENRPQGFWSKRLADLTEQRNRQMRDAVNKAARIVVNHCLTHRIGRVAFGWNDGNKTGINLGKKNNQSFVQVPTARLKERIKQLCERYGIEFVETEESYTSQASFLDSDIIPIYGEKPEDWMPSGNRLKRGLYRTANGLLINADCNGAANILRKVAMTLGLNLERIGRGVLTRPQRIKLWSAKQCQVAA